MKKKFMVLSITFLLIIPNMLMADPYADEVIQYSAGDGVAAPDNNPETALGAPDWTPSNYLNVSLGKSGYIILGFKDNISLNGEGNDLTIYENGDLEAYDVYVSSDGNNYYLLGHSEGGHGSFDYENVPIDRVRYVKIVDDGTNIYLPPNGGADIDAIEAIHSQDCVTEGPQGDPTCSDGIDNDCDGLIDSADPDCAPIHTASTMFADRYPSSDLKRSKVINYLAFYIFIPFAGFFILRGILRRR